jgi:hypothetical protein
MEISVPLRRVMFHLFAALTLAMPIAVHAADSESLHLHLDTGFMGHPVTLNVFEGKAQVAWGANGLAAEGDLDLQYADGVLTVRPSSPSMFPPSSLAVSLPSLQTTSTYEQDAIEQLTASGTWNALDSKTAHGLVTAHASAGSFQVAIVPQGMRVGTASWYKYKHCNCAASPDFPKGTKLLVTRVDDPSRSVIVKVNDYGPDRSLFPDRAIDLDKVAFAAIGNTRGGLLHVIVEPLAPDDPRLKQKAVSS